MLTARQLGPLFHINLTVSSRTMEQGLYGIFLGCCSQRKLWRILCWQVNTDLEVTHMLSTHSSMAGNNPSHSPHLTTVNQEFHS